MGFARERVGADGRARYTAVYRDLKGPLRSAGTFSQRREPTAPGSGPRRRSPRAT